MGAETNSVHIYFFPFMAHGHILPTIDMAKLFASRGHATTIITTPLNAPDFTNTIQRTQTLGTRIHVKTLNFPSVEAGLPEGVENLDSVKSKEMLMNFFRATRLLRQPLEQLLSEHCRDCLVADMFFPWATDVAQKFGIPRLVFHGTSFFYLCASECVRLYEPHKKVSSDSELFIVPNLPDRIEMTRDQLPEHIRHDTDSDLLKLFHEAKESEVKSYGVIVNSFYELEPAYADHFREVLKRRAWAVGPVSLCNRDVEAKAQRGKKPTVDEQECLSWLDSKDPGSVVYVCFGSVARLSRPQLREIAFALESSQQQFIWVVREPGDGGEYGDWMPEGFEARMESEGRGMIIREWAPQVLILDHKAVGAFVTHCGWNSTLEGISAGVPMVTWPVSAEQFYNEKVVTQVLGTGVAVGAKRWVGFFGEKNDDVRADVVGRGAIERALKVVMVGEEAESMRKRATELARMARKVIEEGGSSHSDLNALIEELIMVKDACEASKKWEEHLCSNKVFISNRNDDTII